MANFSNKVSVFISSKCDNKDDVQNGRIKYGVMRKALKLLLEETNMCIVYAFEEGKATSYNVVHSYMDPLADSDLVIVIVDNKDGITDATLNEIGRVKALNKKCLYIFCDECEKNITELQAELQSSTKNPRFAIVHEFSDIAREAYEAVINDVMSIYIGYCRGRLSYGEEKKVDELSEPISNIEIQVAEDSDITKKFISGFPYTKYIAQKEAGIAFGEVECEEEQDRLCASLLGQVIGCTELENLDFEAIKLDIKALHKGNIQKLVSLRYEAVESYFSGDISGCIKRLNACIDFCASCRNIPKWMYNDVALDLRNIQLEDDSEKDIFNYNSSGQEILDQDKEPLYYPVIDRIVSDFNESIVKHQMHNATQSPYRVNLGGVDFIIEKACNAFIVAYYYGSITHMLMLRKRLFEYLTGVALEIRNHKTFMFCVKLLILANEGKTLKQFLNAYGENTNNINALDVKYLTGSIKSQPIKTRKIMARQQILKYFGYYYSEEEFKRESEELIKQIKQYIIDKHASEFLIKSMFEMFAETSYRMQEETVLDFIYFLFESGYKRYYDDAFRFLYRFSFKNLTNDEQNKYQQFIIKSLHDDEIRKKCVNIGWAAQTLRQNETISHEALDATVREKCSNFYEDTYLLNTSIQDEEKGWEYTKKYVEVIRNDNETQGKNGTYSSKAYDPYKTIANIMFIDKLKYKSAQLKTIIGCLKETLLAETQTIEAKVGAMELLCMVHLAHPTNKQIKKVTQELYNDWQEVINAKDLFPVRGYALDNLELYFVLLRTLFNMTEDMELGLRLMYIQNSEIPIQITTLGTLERMMEHGFMSFCSDVEKNTLFQYVMNASYSMNYDVRFCAMAVLTKMVNDNYRTLCLERFVEMMDNEPYKGKVGLLYRLKNEDITDAKVKFIFDKGKNDSHFWVRKVASEVLLENEPMKKSL